MHRALDAVRPAGRACLQDDCGQRLAGPGAGIVGEGQVKPGQYPEDRIAQQHADGVQDGIVDVRHVEGAIKNQRDHQLRQFQPQAHGRGKPKIAFRFEAHQEIDAEPERHGEQDVGDEVSETKRLVQRAAEIKGDQVEAGEAGIRGEGEDDFRDDEQQVEPEQREGEQVGKAALVPPEEWEQYGQDGQADEEISARKE